MKLKNIFFVLMSTSLFLYSCSVGDASSSVTKDCISTPTVGRAEYSITFNATWSKASHPREFPSNPHFSPIVGMVHNDSTSLFETGTKASAGIKSMAETGNASALVEEISKKIKAKTAQESFIGKGIPSSPGTTSIICSVQPSFPLVSIASMIAPSPDWFVSVRNVNLFENGAWVDRKEVHVRVYDAGTEAGNTFKFDNPSEDGTIHRITTAPLATNGVIPSMGTFTFVKR